MAPKRMIGSGRRLLGGVRAPAAMLALGALAALAACASLGSLDLRQSIVPQSGQPVPGANQPFPNLASVPKAAPPSTDKPTRIKLEKELTAESRDKAYQPNAAAEPADLPQPPAPLAESFVNATSPPAPGQGVTAPAATTGPAAPGLGSARLGPRLDAGHSASRAFHGEPAAIVLFDAGSSAIDPSQAPKLKPLVDRLRQSGGSLDIVGYASPDREARAAADDSLANFNLSMARATAVARVLERLGAPASRLSVSAEGATAPPVAGGSAADLAADRRVEIYLAP